MRKITIGFSKPSHFRIGAALIRIVEQTEFSHTYVKIGDDIWQESLPKFNKVGVLDFQKDHIIVCAYILNVTDEQYDKITEFCEYCLRLRIPYGTTQIVGMAIVRMINQLFHCKFKNPFADGPKTMVCSEFVGEVLEIMGVKIDPRLLELEGPKLIRKIVTELSVNQVM